MLALLLPFLPSLAAAKLIALGVVVVSGLAIAGWHQLTTTWATNSANRAGEAAVHAALDNAHEIARRTSQRSTQLAAAADAAHKHIEELKGRLRDEQEKPPTPSPAPGVTPTAAAGCPAERTPLSRVRLLRAIVAGHGGKGG